MKKFVKIILALFGAIFGSAVFVNIRASRDAKKEREWFDIERNDKTE